MIISSKSALRRVSVCWVGKSKAFVRGASSYVVLKGGEAWLIGAHISPLTSTCTHVIADATRSRKLLLHGHELSKLIGHVERKGYTLVPLAMVWRKGRAKLELGLARGKKLHDKRATEKDRDWEREKARVMRRD